MILLIALFFVIAMIYSAAGFGGGSSYLAILAIFPLAFVDIRIIALLCNITVTGGTTYLYYKNGLLPIKRTLPLIVLSIPFAYLGGRYPIEENTFFIILGFSLLVAALLLFFQNTVKTFKSLPSYISGLVGGGIGFLSGIVGIGGGIFLSPILHLSKWSTPKIIAGTTALFILVNSIAGLSGQLVTHGVPDNGKLLLALIVTVFIGGQIGSSITINRLSPAAVKKITGIVILVVALRLLYTSLIA